MSQPTALITGGAGYFGDVIARHLIKRGYKCRIFDIIDPQEPIEGVEYVKGDVLDQELSKKVCEGMDIVHHNIAQLPLLKDTTVMERVNREGTRYILEGAKAHGAKKVIYTSTSAVYGAPKENPLTEDKIPTPMEEYGQSKYDGELVCAEFVKEGLDVSICRPVTIMGYGRLGIFQMLFEWIYTGSNLPVLSGGHNVYQFIHADDFADACIRASEKEGPATYNIGADRYNTMRELLTNLAAYAGAKSKIRSFPIKLAEWGMTVTDFLGISPLSSYHALMYGRSLYFDSSKAEKELGWKAQYSHDDMFQQSYDWYKENREKILNAPDSGSHHQRGVNQGVLKLVSKIL